MEPRGWRTPLASLAQALFPEPHPRVHPELVGPELPASPPVRRSLFARLLPWGSIGVGAAAGVAGVFLGSSSESARSEVRSSFHFPAELDALEGRARSSAIAADVLFGVAAVGVAAGIVLLATD